VDAKKYFPFRFQYKAFARAELQKTPKPAIIIYSIKKTMV
jgi:hypothetical protein